jgi:hypothetical protein
MIIGSPVPKKNMRSNGQNYTILLIILVYGVNNGKNKKRLLFEILII